MTAQKKTPAESIGILLAFVVSVFVASFAARLGWAFAGRVLGAE